jgi:cyclopropane fatty-acyl-phospholipid synthase-like methyltransferase
MQVTNGILSIFNKPIIYNSFQNLVGSNNVRKILVSNYLNLNGNEKILDIGCGTSEILEYLPKGIEYHGYDLSSRYIEHAKKKYGNRGNFYCADATKIKLNKDSKFSRVLALGLLHHLNDDEVLLLFKFVKSILKPDGYLITYDGCYTQTQSKIARYIISKDRGKNVRTLKGYQDLAEQCFTSIHTEIREDLLRIPYTNVIMSCS